MFDSYPVLSSVFLVTKLSPWSIVLSDHVFHSRDDLQSLPQTKVKSKTALDLLLPNLRQTIPTSALV